MLQLMMQQKKNQRPDLIDRIEGIKERKKGKPLSTIFNSMQKLSEGPFSVLHRITNERVRCKVFTRNFYGLRGVLCGYVVGYDRFMNMVMVDVDETFCKSPLGGVAQHQRRLSTSKVWRRALGSTRFLVTRWHKVATHRCSIDILQTCTCEEILSF
ncbi:U7 snRNA-associated Sm-like protein LSm11 isoform X2 [Ciona intestinalis]